jgi:pSer/pThr/pTyr-binding forkhead associated (FHA) protein
VNEVALRAGSIEVLGAIAAFALIAIWPRTRRFQDSGELVPMRIAIDVAEPAGARRIEALCPAIVGRSSECDIMLLDPEVSRRHARFDAQNEVVYVSDVGSSNGTFLNERRLDGSIEVRAGDVIDVGATRLTFVGKQRCAE